MYITCLAESPWAKMAAFRSNLATFRPRPVESRNAFTSKTRLRAFALFGGRGTLIDTLRVAEEAIDKNNMGRRRRICSKLNSLAGGRDGFRLTSAYQFAAGRGRERRLSGQLAGVASESLTARIQSVDLLTRMRLVTSIAGQGHRGFQIHWHINWHIHWQITRHIKRCVPGGADGLILPRPALCGPNVAEISGFYNGCGADVGAGDWRERRDFQRGVRRAAAAAAVCASRAAGAHLR